MIFERFFFLIYSLARLCLQVAKGGTNECASFEYIDFVSHKSTLVTPPTQSVSCFLGARQFPTLLYDYLLK